MITSRMAASGIAAIFVLAGSNPTTAAPKAVAPEAEVVAQPAAASNPIPGIGIVVKRNPGTTSPQRTVSGSDGSFSFQGLPPGNYEVTVAGQAPVAVTVGLDGQIKGVATTRGVMWSRVKNNRTM
jgi:hypothetical protein